ncbi:hypothetical protein CCO03_14685 [Comamonas serinivorans]|uniref:Zinc-ribbon domain-containing protein n=1 Tax=Comamonas serinivorans TaxID=1082851 RepID=A0A1Y0EQ36_9BURK|nr:putative zinc-binding metallopeptidase [Comamonas serinivorans]ARU05765.1 hypothetical protein CCO03_14685 [Comamonas serinivorans]
MHNPSDAAPQPLAPTAAYPATSLSTNPSATPSTTPSASRAYTCQCGRPVYLRNSQCLACGTPLGYVVARRSVLPLAPRAGVPQADVPQADAARFTVVGEDGGAQYQRCANFEPIGCNWMVPVDGEAHAQADANLAPGLCLSCSCTRTIPDLAVAGNLTHWRKLETAKRRVLSQLLVLGPAGKGLPLTTRHAAPDSGLAFDILTDTVGADRVLTGHQDGVITLNAEEADDAVRERIRTDMHEPYRTLVGHFRHELGHYFWDVLVRDAPVLGDFRQLFGDETQDYAAALRQHYDNGPPGDWPSRFVTSYASTHPWEDWAETWAHYLHMADTVDTAVSFGLDAGRVELSTDLFTPQDLWRPDAPEAAAFLEFLNTWVRLTNALNELSRSMGQPDFYPFVLPHAAVPKLQFIHALITAQSSPST